MKTINATMEINTKTLEAVGSHELLHRLHWSEARSSSYYMIGNELRKRMQDRWPEHCECFGYTKKGIYRHNKQSGFNELIDITTGEFTGESPY